MRYIWQHIEAILKQYNGSMPLTHFLKGYFMQHPKLGSRDRKTLSEMAYSWYRCSKTITVDNFAKKVQTCLYLCSNGGKHIQAFLPAWPATDDTTERIAIVEQQGIPVNMDVLFEESLLLSTGIDRTKWMLSMLSQPNLFIRIRKNKDRITTVLDRENVPYTFINDTCLALPNGAKIDALLHEDSYVVQDASSQHTGHYFLPHDKQAWYDCCAGAGGKSLLLKDLAPTVQLTVSDKRDSILHNLKQRFKQYHIPAPDAHILDVANKEQLQKAFGSKRFDNIICDVPCSGSGTWARTPEQLYFFDKATLDNLPALQQTIAVNATQYLKTGGHLIYITCSVFQKENEDVVAEVIKETGLTLDRTALINGIDQHADSMYVAVLKK